MKHTQLITSYLKTRLASLGLPTEEIEWAVGDLAAGISLDMIPMADTLYSRAQKDKTFVAFYGDLSLTYSTQFLYDVFPNQENRELCLYSISNGTKLYIRNFNGSPQVYGRMRNFSTMQEQYVVDKIVEHLNMKYTEARIMLIEEIQQIIETGVHTMDFPDERQIQVVVGDIFRALHQDDMAA